MQYPESLLQAILRQDFCSFINKVFNSVNPGTEYKSNWHIELIAEYLEAVHHRQIKRLIINLPPRGLKSLCISVAWPAWVLGHDPSKRIMAASYSQVLSIKHSMDCRLVMSSDWYKQIFPQATLSKKHNQKSKFLTEANGFRFATSVGGSATGEGGDFLIIDDPHNPLQVNSPKLRHRVIEWFEQTFITRLNDKNNGAIILVMQRLHSEDLSGHLLSNSDHWEHLKIPVKASENIKFYINNKEYAFLAGEVLHQERDQTEHLLKLEQEIGLQAFAAQYLQEPIPQKYSLLALEDIHFYETMPDRFDYFIQSWDTAIKVSENADYSVCTVYGVIENIYYLVSMLRAKLTYPDLKKNIEQLAGKYQPKFILIEDRASGQQIIQDFKFNGFKNIIAIKPKLDKVTRFASIVPMFQASKILIPKKSSFNNVLLQELLNFPNSKNDDIIDSISQCLNFSKEARYSTTVRIRDL